MFNFIKYILAYFKKPTVLPTVTFDTIESIKNRLGKTKAYKFSYFNSKGEQVSFPDEDTKFWGISTGREPEPLYKEFLKMQKKNAEDIKYFDDLTFTLYKHKDGFYHRKPEKESKFRKLLKKDIKANYKVTVDPKKIHHAE